MENNIPTAEEFIPQYLDVDYKFMKSIKNQMSKMRGFDFDNIPDLMVSFTKIHVEKALKEQKSKLNDLVKYGAINETWEEVQKTIDNAYPLTNIK